MIRYFCECCGKEMDNISSRQIRFMVKDRENREECRNDEYSHCDDFFNICEDCSMRIISFIEADKRQSSQPEPEDEVLADEEGPDVDDCDEDYCEEEEETVSSSLTFGSLMRAFVSGFRDGCK